MTTTSVNFGSTRSQQGAGLSVLRRPGMWVLTGLLWGQLLVTAVLQAGLVRVAPDAAAWAGQGLFPHGSVAVVARDAQRVVVMLTGSGSGRAPLPVLLALAIGVVARDVVVSRPRATGVAAAWVACASAVLVGISAACRGWLAGVAGIGLVMPLGDCVRVWVVGCGVLVLAGVAGSVLGGVLRGRMWRWIGLVVWVVAEQVLSLAWPADGGGVSPASLLPLAVARDAGRVVLEGPACGVGDPQSTLPVAVCLVVWVGWVVTAAVLTGWVERDRGHGLSSGAVVEG